MEIWPNFFIVGAPKAGTTSLYEYLRTLPGIFMPKEKEPSFFCKIKYESAIQNKNEYLKLYEKVTDEKIIGDASVMYLSEPGASRQIFQTVPNAKILISLRNPVERAYSQYLMHLTKKQLTTSFHEQLLKELNQSFDHRGPHIQLECGLYSEDVKRFLNTFEKNNVKIIIFEEFIKNIEDTVEEILKFLDQYSKITNFNNKVHNKFSPARGTISERILTSKSLFKISKRIMSKSTRKSLIDKFLIGERVKPKMDAEDRDALIKYYKSDVIILKKILGRELPWPDFQ